MEATLTSGGRGRPRWRDAEHSPVCTSARAPSAPGPKGVFILQTPVQGFRERVFSSQLFPFPGPADFRKWISHFQNTVPTDRQSKLCTDRSEEECWQGRGGVPAKGKKIAPVDVQVVSFKDNIEIGGRGEGRRALRPCRTVLYREKTPPCHPGVARGRGHSVFPEAPELDVSRRKDFNHFRAAIKILRRQLLNKVADGARRGKSES